MVRWETALLASVPIAPTGIQAPQAWNADQSLLLIVNGCNALCFLDGHTYAPLFQRQRGGECEWHPQDPELMICVAGYRISRWAPRSNTEDVILDLKAYRELQFGPYKGNPSWDSNRIVVRATNQEGALVAFVVDLSTRQKFPDIALAQLPGTNHQLLRHLPAGQVHILPAGSH